MERKITLAQFKKRFIIVFLCLFLVSVIIIEITDEIDTLSYIRLRINGIKAVAVVTDTNRSHRENTRYLSPRNNLYTETIHFTRYLIKYNFSVENQIIDQHKWFSIPDKDWEGADTTKQIAVIYNYNNPHINTPEIIYNKYPSNFIIKLVLGIVGSIVMVISIAFITYQDLRRRECLRK